MNDKKLSKFEFNLEIFILKRLESSDNTASLFIAGSITIVYLIVVTDDKIMPTYIIENRSISELGITDWINAKS